MEPEKDVHAYVLMLLYLNLLTHCPEWWKVDNSLLLQSVSKLHSLCRLGVLWLKFHRWHLAFYFAAYVFFQTSVGKVRLIKAGESASKISLDDFSESFSHIGFDDCSRYCTLFPFVIKFESRCKDRRTFFLQFSSYMLLFVSFLISVHIIAKEYIIICAKLPGRGLILTQFALLSKPHSLRHPAAESL